jgi:hypothetical protein
MFPRMYEVPFATRTASYWVTGFAYRRVISTLKMPPTVVIDATHPLLSEKVIAPDCGCVVGVMGRMSLPTVPTAVGGVHSGGVAVVVEVVDVDVVVAVTVEVTVVVLFVEVVWVEVEFVVLVDDVDAPATVVRFAVKEDPPCA